MKIMVIGGSGLIGKKLIALLRQEGHQAMSASPSSGVNTITGEGLAQGIAGTDVVVDVTNSPSFEDKAVMEFFETSTRNILSAEASAGGKHHVALSVVGADRLSDSGYMRAKFAQERLIRASGVPFTIVRATQFFEFIGTIAGHGSDEVHLSSAPMQPMAADDVAAALAEVAVRPPVNSTLEIAGPESRSIADFVREALAASGDTRSVVNDPDAPYFGAVLDDLGLLPTGANPRICSTHFETWLSRIAAPVQSDSASRSTVYPHGESAGTTASGDGWHSCLPRN